MSTTAASSASKKVAARSRSGESTVLSNSSIAAASLLMVLTAALYGGDLFSQPELRALGLSTFAGLSTSIGAAAAVIRRPDDATLAFLLGLALGVMATLSVVELWINNALDNGAVAITAATLAGAALYYFVQPYFPEFEMSDSAAKGEELPLVDEDNTATPVERTAAPQRRVAARTHTGSPSGSNSPKVPAMPSIPPAELFRLGVLMSLTMTLHNLPEGLAVAFSSYTDLGVVMAVAIAMHNIPEGIIVAAPIYAATGSRARALLIATLSGLSEPLGALLALIFVKPFLTPQRLHCMLAFTGGIMLAVCIVELWPEARKCKRDFYAWQGIILGSVLMGLTLAADV